MDTEKKVLDAFTDKKALSTEKLSTDGQRLDGHWMGGARIAEWKDDRIVFNDLGSKTAQRIQHAIRRLVPAKWIATDAGSAVTPGPTEGPQKILVYVMADKGVNPGHKFLTLRRTTKNAKGRYVTAEQFQAFGLLWPTSTATTRDDIALAIGRAILDESNV